MNVRKDNSQYLGIVIMITFILCGCGKQVVEVEPVVTDEVQQEAAVAESTVEVTPKRTEEVTPEPKVEEQPVAEVQDEESSEKEKLLKMGEGKDTSEWINEMGTSGIETPMLLICNDNLDKKYILDDGEAYQCDEGDYLIGYCASYKTCPFSPHARMVGDGLDKMHSTKYSIGFSIRDYELTDTTTISADFVNRETDESTTLSCIITPPELKDDNTN